VNHGSDSRCQLTISVMNETQIIETTNRDSQGTQKKSRRSADLCIHLPQQSTRCKNGHNMASFAKDHDT
jgi:hypothetical protein